MAIGIHAKRWIREYYNDGCNTPDLVFKRLMNDEKRRTSPHCPSKMKVVAFMRMEGLK